MTEPHAIDRDDVMAWLDGELPPVRAAEVSAHVSACASCQALADDLRQVSARLQAWDVDVPPATSRLPRALEEALRPSPGPAPESDRRGPAGRFGLSWPQWGFATAALAGIALVAVVWNPLTDRTIPAPAFESAAADRVAEPGAAPRADSARPERAVEETVPVPVVEPPAAPPATAQTAPAPPPPPPAPPAQTPPPPPPTGPPVGFAARADERAAVVSGGVAGGIPGGNVAGELREAEPAAMARATSLTLSVEDIAAARARLEALAGEAGGSVEPRIAGDAQSLTAFGGGGRGGRVGGGSASSDTVILMIPEVRLDDVLEGARAIGAVLDPIESATDMSVQMKAAADDVSAARTREQQTAAAAAAAPPGSAAATAAGRQLEDARRETARLEAIARDLEARAGLVRVTIRIVRGG